MALTELTCEGSNQVPASISIEGANLLDGVIVSARVGDGELAIHTDNVLSPEENIRFVVRALGRNMLQGVPIGLDKLTEAGRLKPGQEHTLRQDAARKLGAAETGTAGAISNCFQNGKFNVTRPLTITGRPPLTERETHILQLLSTGSTVPSAAIELGIGLDRVKQLRTNIFAFLGTQTVYGATTIGYLAGILPVR
jgi:DNA-binding CsgD family transcriptional regulator